MAYKVVYLDQVEKDLRTLGKATARKILNRIETCLVQDPKELGKALTGDFRGYWRYRWGDYRVIYKIVEHEILIYILWIGHRKDIYDRTAITRLLDKEREDPRGLLLQFNGFKLQILLRFTLLSFTNMERMGGESPPEDGAVLRRRRYAALALFRSSGYGTMRRIKQMPEVLL